MKIAVLLPNSTTHKQLGYDFYLALQYALATNDTAVEWMSASIGFGVDEADMLSKAEDMLLNRGADLLVVFADYPKVSHIFSLLEASNKELLVVNMGAKLPECWKPHPLVFHLNLQECLIAHVGGKTLYHEGDTRATLASNYYEGGYAPCQLVVDAYGHAGGAIEYNFIPQANKGQSFSIAALASYLNGTQDPSAVIASYSNPLTNSFLTQWKESINGEDKRLWCSSTLLMDALADKQPLLNDLSTVTGIVAWYRELDTPQNKSFVQAFEQKLNRPASYAAALGWDTGLLLIKAIESTDDGNGFILSAIFNFNKLSLELTRGKGMFDSESHTLLAPVYRLRVENAQLIYERINTDSVVEEWQDLKRAHPVPNQNGWYNTYLCS